MPTRLHHGKLLQTTHRFISSSSSSTVKPKTIFSGIQPTGIPHLGNYLGALRQWVTLQNDTTSPHNSKFLFCIVDLHALTIKQDPLQLKQWKKETLATLLAIGLDPKKSILFYQSSVPAHAELHWILSCSASMGYLSRMTQWKSKLALPTSNQNQGEELSALDAITKQKLKLGLFSYPVLQAADILVHGATHVPVGEDQVQHIEFARECAGNFNSLYGKDGEGKILVKPESVVSSAKRIMSLQDPRSKMSKSAKEEGSRMLLTDETDVVKKKIAAALTDSVEGVSYDIERRPGVSNLIDILVYLSSKGTSREDVLQDLKGASLKSLKARVATEVEREIAPIRERIRQLIHEKDTLYDIARDGAVRANEGAAVTLGKVREAVGAENNVYSVIE